MPIYRYSCKKCNYSIEELKSVNDRHVVPPCCKGEEACNLKLEICPSMFDLRGEWKSTTGKLDMLYRSERELVESEKYVPMERYSDKNLGS